ncbi:MAG: hypothetical protein PHX57_15035 [Desulfobulbaceae bacterium]|nr:hypothetical protein [Desulfobulbaceae bacterium]
MNLTKLIGLFFTVWKATGGKKTIFGAVIAVCGAILTFFGYAAEAQQLEDLGRLIVESGVYVQAVGLFDKLLRIAIDLIKERQAQKAEMGQ